MATKFPYYNPEIWGGMECTINRVENCFRDQLFETGHYHRANDIERIATLGFSKIRYPLLWERHQPAQNAVIDWRWITTQLDALQQHHIIPIAGLLHHGSGPAFTHLLDENFSRKLAHYAGLVARQFPWLEYYTPINEPLTTARFSGLYGHWYPHHVNELSFFKMLLNQVKGIILSMKTIRTVNPHAKLVQTEDLAKTHSTPLLAYQAVYENQRRWLTYDLLCGSVDQGHFFWQYLIDLGVKEEELFFFLEHTCPPDIMGFNYYVTSERYLTERYGGLHATLGGNGKHFYNDMEAVRSGHAQGLSALLQEAWARFHLPMAVTECHLNCTPGQQLRWLKDTWDSCCQLNQIGIPIKAVTAWAIIGAVDWNSLLTKTNLNYESGVFEASGWELRETELAAMIRTLTQTGRCVHPLLAEKGWWYHQQLRSATTYFKTKC